MKFYWNDRKEGVGIYKLIVEKDGYKTITLYDIQAFRQIEPKAGEPLYAYSGAMPDGIYHSMSSLKARNIENAKMEVMKIYKEKLTEEDKRAKRRIREIKEELKALELLINHESDGKEKKWD